MPGRWKSDEGWILAGKKALGIGVSLKSLRLYPLGDGKAVGGFFKNNFLLWQFSKYIEVEITAQYPPLHLLSKHNLNILLCLLYLSHPVISLSVLSFDEPFENQLQMWWHITLKYFYLHLLRIRTVSHITTTLLLYLSKLTNNNIQYHVQLWGEFKFGVR